MTAVAKQLLKEATWGVKLRLYLGAGLSMLDLASDITVIMVYLNDEQMGNAYSLLAMIVTCLALQVSGGTSAERSETASEGEGVQ